MKRTDICKNVAYERTLRFPETALRRKERFRENIHNIYKNRLWRNAGLKGVTKERVTLRDVASHTGLYSLYGGAPKTWEELTVQEQSLVQEHLEALGLSWLKELDDAPTTDLA